MPLRVIRDVISESPERAARLIELEDRILELAIEARDLGKFNAAYARLTEGCNSCHAALNHEFIVIKEPDRSLFGNQDFRQAK